jgi:predicted ABC-type ATPase
MDKPQLSVFAGPNGAGKSTVSNWLFGNEADVFDGDKLHKQLSEAHPNTAWEELNRLSAQIFEEKWRKAVLSRDDFAYETNFTYPQSISLPTTFRENGYETNLLYIGLDNIQKSIDRVAMRVAEGGHYVDDGSIELNFSGGIYHVIRHFAFFDRVLFIDNPIVTKPRIVLRAECGEIKSKSPTLPRCGRQTFIGF